MTDFENQTDANDETSGEHYPLEPRYHPVHRITRRIYDFLASAKLAMFLLITILVCSIAGTTIFRGAQAVEKIFSSIWFNGLLVLLVVNVACCFFGRVWHRKLTVISLGMILFHLCFVAMLLGIIYNSLFYFRGDLRITEGEVLNNRERQSYDGVERGRFFSLSKLKGETTFNRLVVGYKVGGNNKRVAYDISVGEGTAVKNDTIYLTHNLNYNGFTYLPDREGYSVLTVLSDKNGNELYGAFVPLQSLKQKDGSYLYVTGSKTGPGTIVFPHPPETPRFEIRIKYRPDLSKERSGNVNFQIFPLKKGDSAAVHEPSAEGTAAVGDSVAVGDYRLSVKEVRYWVVMWVNYEPGKPIVLTSLWVGLAGLILTTVGRIIRSNRKEKEASVRA